MARLSVFSGDNEYRLEQKINRGWAQSYYDIITHCYPSRILHEGDIIAHLEYLPNGPYEVVEAGKDQNGFYARVKECPFIEEFYYWGKHKKITQESMPIYDKIVSLLYNKNRIGRDYFFKDIVYLTSKGFIFSYNEVMNSFNIDDDILWPFKKYLEGVINATEVYSKSTNVPKALSFLENLLKPYELQIGNKNGQIAFHINCNPGSGYYCV